MNDELGIELLFTILILCLQYPNEFDLWKVSNNYKTIMLISSQPGLSINTKVLGLVVLCELASGSKEMKNELKKKKFIHILQEFFEN